MAAEVDGGGPVVAACAAVVVAWGGGVAEGVGAEDSDAGGESPPDDVVRGGAVTSGVAGRPSAVDELGGVAALPRLGAPPPPPPVLVVGAEGFVVGFVVVVPEAGGDAVEPREGGAVVPAPFVRPEPVEVEGAGVCAVVAPSEAEGRVGLDEELTSPSERALPCKEGSEEVVPEPTACRTGSVDVREESGREVPPLWAGAVGADSCGPGFVVVDEGPAAVDEALGCVVDVCVVDVCVPGGGAAGLVVGSTVEEVLVDDRDSSEPSTDDGPPFAAWRGVMDEPGSPRAL